MSLPATRSDRLARGTPAPEEAAAPTAGAALRGETGRRPFIALAGIPGPRKDRGPDARTELEQWIR